MSKTYENIKANRDVTPKKDWMHIKTIDMHTGGEPLRVIVDGFPELKGNSVLDYRNDCKKNYDYLRTSLLLEPRGHSDMYGCILTPPNDETGDFGIIFLHNEGYSTMCGHAIIAISTLAIEMRWIEVQEGENKLEIDAPCGRITSFTSVKNGEVQGVKFHCVPSFVLGFNQTIEIPNYGKIIYDLAYGGAFYAYVDLQKNKFDFELSTESYQDLIRVGMDIKNNIVKSGTSIEHPYEEDLSFLYGTIFTDTSAKDGIDSKNVCIFAEGEVDRCPTGSGVSGRMAIHYHRKELPKDRPMAIESITGSVFKGSVVSKTVYGSYEAVIPLVEGTAYITGSHTFFIDPKDPMKKGFLLR